MILYASSEKKWVPDCTITWGEKSFFEILEEFEKKIEGLKNRADPEKERFLLLLEESDSEELGRIFGRIFDKNSNKGIFLIRIEAIIRLYYLDKGENSNMSALLTIKDDDMGLLLANNKEELKESIICLSILV